MRRDKAWIGACVLELMSIICVPCRAFGQECPQASKTGLDTPSQVLKLEGRLVFHDDIRRWFELKLFKPQCGLKSIQLLQIQKADNSLAIFRGCRVKSIGAIAFSPTGYYSLGTFQDVKSIEPVSTCVRQPLFPEYSGLKPDKTVHAYRVNMHVIYSHGDHPIAFRVSSAGKELRPWQAYASYDLTGGYVLYGHCGDGFVIQTVFGTPQAHPTHFDDSGTPEDMAEFDPEGAASSGKSDLHLGYTCVRAQ